MDERRQTTRRGRRAGRSASPTGVEERHAVAVDALAGCLDAHSAAVFSYVDLVWRSQASGDIVAAVFVEHLTAHLENRCHEATAREHLLTAACDMATLRLGAPPGDDDRCRCTTIATSHSIPTPTTHDGVAGTPQFAALCPASRHALVHTMANDGTYHDTARALGQTDREVLERLNCALTHLACRAER